MATTYNLFEAYLESKLLSASPLELVALAYEGAIEAVREARVCVVEKRIHDRARAITKVQLIIIQLQQSLDFKLGGDLSLQLDRLYKYMQRRLMEANFKQQEAPLADVETLLETLLDGWKQIAQQERPAHTAFAAATSSSSSSQWMTSSESQPYSFTDLTL